MNPYIIYIDICVCLCRVSRHYSLLLFFHAIPLKFPLEAIK